MPTGTIGLVITGWHHALHETDDPKNECSTGYTAGDYTNAEAQPDHAELRRKFGHPYSRGPNGELTNYSPMAVEDPIPPSELTTRTGYGLNLDGTADGKATPRTCAHAKFASPEGVQVDNQLARVVGCTKGWRKGGFSDAFYNEEIYTNPVNRILIEITGVDDERNDPQVEVAIYKGEDRLTRDPAGKYIPFLTQRIDARFPEYSTKLRGRIVDGVLITDPDPDATARLPIRWIAKVAERRIRDLQLRIPLAGSWPVAMLAGYEDNKIWWNSQKAHHIAMPAAQNSPPSQYRALMRYADGYPDPKTGQCTAISAAYRVETVRAFIAHPETPQQRTAAATMVHARCPCSDPAGLHGASAIPS
ncbi:hypothetical protein [Sphingomonas solaris]|uniref:Uncharacterized protein n=1 Tax=Alterirhizorhabdus solaris TaxID=2529389 RepID=A0A558R8X9_9SPHN|nr:hypothetical protein [Sphingomonas solaris]TVV75827.1 hypothetical protein FOY91_05980 [Sphingomonas solaris]